jgi:predicted signal transduction protein with EAL and GGDEF domain/DNA-binding response OmpR family regulator
MPIRMDLEDKAAGGSARDGDCVLLIDDDPVVRLLTVAALSERGWRVVEASGGAEALEIFVRERPQVIVLDAMMPAPDGFETCERLRKLPGGEHVPVLMLTGLDDEHSIARAYEVGATDFFVKTSGQWTLLSERLRYMLRAAHMREELLTSQEKLNKAQRIARLGSWEWDFRTRRIRVSDECRSIVGLSVTDGDVPEWHAWSRVAPEDRGRIERLFRDTRDSGLSLTFESSVMHTDGRARIVRVEAEFERDENRAAVAMHGVIQDVTERRQAEDQIRRLANYDSLTGLPNRRFLREEFGATIERASGADSLLALLFVDIDRFKHINDTLGHEVGDQVLREVAWRLHSTVRESDTVARLSRQEHRANGQRSATLESSVRSDSRVARLGGDEFTVLLTNVGGPDEVSGILQRVVDGIRVPIDCFGHEVHVTASIGVALFPRDGEDVDGLLRKADLAMYAAKAKGGNSWRTFEESMNVAVAARWHLEAGLHHALERKELVLHYQPKIDITTGRIVGAEALMRWVRNGNLIVPGEFISAAEESGLIVPITEWAIAQVCWQISEWRRQGLAPLPVAVNISSGHFQRGNLAAPVQESLARNGVAAQLLEVELTETVLMRDLDVALPLLDELKRLGVSISIDDFGTGYSSLAYLRRLPIDTIKIDRSFVMELEVNSDSATIVAAIIAMANALKLRTIAEGVETRAQMLALSGYGCTLMQGFLFSRPLPPEEFARLVANADSLRMQWRSSAREPAPAEKLPAAVSGTTPTLAVPGPLTVAPVRRR